MELRRRARIDQRTTVENAIGDVIGAIESMPPDPRLTEAQVLLAAAQDAVADYVDGIRLVRRYPSIETVEPPPEVA